MGKKSELPSWQRHYTNRITGAIPQIFFQRIE